MQHLKKLNKHEEIRKLAHITIGCLIAGASLYIDRWQIIAFICLGLLVDIFIVKRIEFLSSLVSVERKSYGDYAYMAGIVMSALLFDRPFTFIAACLALAVSDGLAGLLGRAFGRHEFSWFGAHKTILGSTVFFCMTYFIVWQLLIASQVSAENAFIGAAVIALPSTLVEAAIGYGLDNFGVPIVVGILFEMMV